MIVIEVSDWYPPVRIEAYSTDNDQGMYLVYEVWGDSETASKFVWIWEISQKFDAQIWMGFCGGWCHRRDND